MRRPPILTPRLQRLADWVPDGAAFADIGTDHGYLPVWLTLHGRVCRALASDIRQRPLQRAVDTARRYGVTEIQFRLCDGLSGIRPDEADTIVIAGLGGENIAAILEQALWTADGCHTLLLQPMTRAEVLRRFLADHGYAIRRETLVRDRGVLYPLMEAAGGHMRLSPGQWYGGAKLTHDPLGNHYLVEMIIRLQYAVVGLSRSANPEKQREANRLREVLRELYAMREEWRYANSPGN